jgi:hypothetical protein
MKTLLFLLLLVATSTNVFSQRKYINKKEYEKIMKSFEGETKASRGQVIVAFEDWLNSQKYFTTKGLLESDAEKSDIEGKYVAWYPYIGALEQYNVSVIEKFDELRERALFIKDTIITTKYFGKTIEITQGDVEIVMGREIRSNKINEVEKVTSKHFDIKFEAFTTAKNKTSFKIIVQCFHNPEEIGKTTRQMNEYNYINEPKAYSFDIIKEIQDYIYKKVGK